MVHRAGEKEEKKGRNSKGPAFARVLFYLLCGLFPLAVAMLLPVGIKWRPGMVVGGLVVLRYGYLLWMFAGAQGVIRLRRRITLSPAEPANYFRLAVTLYQRGFAGEAVNIFRQGMRLDPGMLVETPEGAVRILCGFGTTPREKRTIRTLCGLALMEHMVEEAGSFPKPLSEIMALDAEADAGRSVLEEVEELSESLRNQRDGVELLVQCVPPKDYSAFLTLDSELRRLEHRIRELDEIKKQLS